MKILLTTDTYLPTINGVVTSVCNLKTALVARGHDVRVLTLSPKQYTTEDTREVLYLPSLPLGLYPDARVSLPVHFSKIQELLHWSPDVVHSQSEFSTFLYAKQVAKKCGAPLVHSYHTLYQDYTHYFCPEPKLGKYMVKEFTRQLSKLVAMLCAPMVKVQRTLESYGVQSPITILPTGIDLSAFQTPISASEREAFRKRCDLQADDQILLALGRVAKEKGFDKLLDGLAPLLRNHAKRYLVVAGDGPYRKELEKLVCSLGLSDKVRFTGMLCKTEVATCYHASDLFLSASSSETQGLTYLEAMASGLPQIVYQDDCLMGVVENGVNGYQYQTVQELGTLVETVLGDATLYHRLSEQAQHFAQRFDITVFGASAEALYQSLLEH